MICLPTIMVGFKETSASWKIIEHSLPRKAYHSLSEKSRMLLPSYRIWLPSLITPGFSIRPISDLEVTDFPQPDSPTMAVVLPFSISKLTPRTDCTSPA